jgi:predicted transcriptional regulator
MEPKMSKRLCYRFLRLLLERPQQTQRFEVSQSDIMLTMGISLQTCHKLAQYWIKKQAIEEKRTGSGHVDYCLLPQGFQYLAPSRWQKRLFIGGIILVLFFMYLSQ